MNGFYLYFHLRIGKQIPFVALQTKKHGYK